MSVRMHLYCIILPVIFIITADHLFAQEKGLSPGME